MRIVLLLIILSALPLTFVRAQQTPYRVVFDLTSRDSLDQKALVRWVREITTSNKDAEVEVVMYGKGFELVMPERSAFLSDVQEEMKNPHVSFAACAVALKNNKVEQSQLLPGVRIVPDGIYEIIDKQHQQWGYIKAVH